MAKLLLNLRNVPDDEADEVRAWLIESGMDFYETQPSPWGISSGGIWMREDADIVRAKALMADYQAKRLQRARAAQYAAREQGSEETFGKLFSRRPWYVLGVLAAIIGIVALTLGLPYLFLR
ncbi:DUF6164 family protein [Pseudoxanthomonas sp. CF125]|uniref:DUF6164 family protein n=1 Tax=Pseudoxanthomonas sp. CF125 TaxID=1855303 RepID=UPI000880BD93|nr:DUF6164 family protein [Pseudoxanthomonas sp. CF125]SDQ26920.1 hypothetical protein SAMN05216569_0386 [Pseudoxanthomonas sp. CF125]